MTRFFLIMLLLTKACSASAQVAGTSGIEYSFLHDSIELKANNFQFNSLKLLNKTGAPLHCSIKPEYASFINLISEPEESYELPAGEAFFIPFRFQANSTENVDSTYRFAAVVTIRETGETIRTEFRFRLKPYYKWRNTLSLTEQTVTEDMRHTSTHLRIENTGNTRDAYIVTLSTPDGITGPKKIVDINLPPGEISEVEIPLQLNTFMMRSNSELHIYVSNSRGEKRMVIQKFQKISHILNQNVRRWERMPLTVELNMRNLMTEQSLINAAIRGNVGFGNGRGLELFVMSKNYYKGLQVSNDQGMIRYRSPKDVYEAGYLTNFDFFPAYGIGFSGTHNINDRGSFISGGYIHSRLYESDTYNAGIEHVINKYFTVRSTNYYNQHLKNGSRSLLNISSLLWQPLDKTKIELKAGGGHAIIGALKQTSDTSMTDFMGGYSLEHGLKKWNFTTRLDIFGKNFPGINKGFNKHYHEIRRSFKKGNIQAYYNADKRVYNQSADSSIKSFFVTNNKDYGIRGQINRTGFYVSPGAGIFVQQQDSSSSFRANMIRGTMLAGWNGIKNLSVTASGQLGYVRMSKPMGIDKYFAMTSMLSVQYKFFGLTLQYDHNPFYYYEMKQSVISNHLLRRLQIIPHVDVNFPKYNLNYKAQYFYVRDDLNAYTFDYITNQVTYRMQKLGMSLTLNGTISTIQKKNSYTSIVLQKDIFAPYYRKNKSFDFKAVFFKDKNSNNQLDAGVDEIIPNADVLVNGQWLRTGADGTLDFRNIGEGTTELDFSRTSNSRGWIPRDGLKQRIDNSKVGRRLLVAFKESRTIKGKLLLVADERSDKRMTLNNIRITATDEKGNVYHTLTDNNEEFFFDLPAGKFKVSINQEAFDVDFIPTETYKEIDLTQSSSEEISFEIRQRKRKLNIKVDDDDDDDDDDEEAADDEE